MRDDEFNSWLRSGASQLAGATHPPSADVIRRRGDRRRLRIMVASGVLTFAVGAGGGGVAYASLSHGSTAGPSLAAGATSSATATLTPSANAAASSSASAAIPDVVAVSTAGSVELLSTRTGLATKVLVAKVDAVGDEVAVTPDGKTVYYAVKSGCTDIIYSIPVTGGTPAKVTTGALPAVSPDGTELAFVREPYTAYPYEPIGCTSGLSSAHPGKDFSVVVRNLTTGSERVYPANPAAPLPVPISHLSWAPSGGTLLVSIASAQDNEGWALHPLNTATDEYFTGTASLSSGARDYYPEGVYQPDGNIFAVRECCAGIPVKPSSILLQEITASGAPIRTVASGFLDRVHSSLDAVSGKALYLSGNTLFVSVGGQPAHLVAPGLISAAWLPAT